MLLENLNAQVKLREQENIHNRNSFLKSIKIKNQVDSNDGINRAELSPGKK